MGVDIQSYPVRIGTNIFAHGTDVVLLQCCVIISAGLNAVGAITFIVMLLLMAGIEPNPGPPKKDWQAHSDKDSTKSPLEAHFVRFRAINRSRKLQENMRPQCRLTRNSIEVSTNEVEDLQAQSDEDSANNPPLGAHFVRLRATDMQPQRSVIKSSEEVSTNEVEAQQKKTNVSVKPKSLSTMDDPKTSKKVSEIPAMTTQEPKPNVSVNQQSSCSIIYANPNITESQVPGKKMERRSQASPLDQHNPDVSMQKVSVPKAPPVRQPHAYQLYAARVYKKESAVQGSNGPAMGDMAESAAVTADIAGTEEVVSQRSTDTTKHPSEQTALVVIPSDVTVYKGSPTKDSDGPVMSDMTESTDVTGGIADTKELESQRRIGTPKHQSEQTALVVILSDVTVYKGSPTKDSDGPAMSDMTESTDVTGGIADTKELASQRRIDTPKHQSEHTALDVIPPDVTKYKGTPTKRSNGPAMGDMAKSAAVTADIAGTEEVVSQRSTDTTKHQSEQTALVVIPSDVTVYKGSPTKDSDGPAMSDMTESTDVTGAIADTKEVASQRRIGTPKHQSEHTALDVIPPDVTKYKGARTKRSNGPAMGDMAESAAVTADIAGTEEVVSQRSTDTTKHQSEQTALVVIPSDVTVYKGSPTKDSDGPAMSDMTESTDVTGAIADTKEVASQRRIGTPKHQSEHTALDVIPPDVTKYKGARTKITTSPPTKPNEAVKPKSLSTMGGHEDSKKVSEIPAMTQQPKPNVPVNQQSPCSIIDANTNITESQVPGLRETDTQQPHHSVTSSSKEVSSNDVEGLRATDTQQPHHSVTSSSKEVSSNDVEGLRATDTQQPHHSVTSSSKEVSSNDVEVPKAPPVGQPRAYQLYAPRVYKKESGVQGSNGPAIGDMAESAAVTADIAGTEEVVSQMTTDTTKHQSEQTALVVIPSDVTVYKGSPKKDSDGPAMSDMTESTDVTGGIADTKAVASQRRIDNPQHQSEHTALDVIPQDVPKYKGAPTKRAETSSHDVAENLSASDAHTQLSKRKYLGTHPVHISNLVGPDWKVSTRAVDHGHIQDLQSPFQGSFHGQLVVLYGIVQKRMLGKVEEPGSCQIQTIGGNHTRIALQELRSKGVETPSLVQCHLYCDTIPRENALVLGLHHDMVHEELSKPLSFLDKAKIMRDVRPEDRDSKKWKRRIGLIFKEDNLMKVMGKFSLYMAVASLEDSLWELAVRVEDKLSTPIVKTMMEVLPDRKRDALEALEKGMNNFKSLIASVKSEEGEEKSNKRKAENDVEVLQEEVSVSAVESSPSLELQELRKRYDDLKEAFNRLKEEQSMKEDFSDGEEVSVIRVEDGQTILYDAVILKKEYYIKYVADNQRGRVGQASLKKK
ncbi:uncharacterized protein LOC128238487 isoform X3 [Mya arenaria]|uniref:uncharacterized protein LOC128238487 isoform X3 n=1 Tax=Mya arenaria TaxID=6604 RepID=UPI0022DEE1AC|nr:uncharacterized protein LOC128238487 isoform X3 [Mya arenaria]